MRKLIVLLIFILCTGYTSCSCFQSKVREKKTLLVSDMEAILPPPPEGAFQIPQFGVTWYFDADYEYGQYANGDYWVVGPVSIIYISPLSYKSRTGRVCNGSMLNPSPTNGIYQGYDSAMYGQYGPAYDPDLNVGFPGEILLSEENPLILLPGSSLVSTISVPEAGARSQLDTAAILTVVSSAPPVGSFRPPYCGSDKIPHFNVSDLSTAGLSSLAPVAETPSMAFIERYFERPWIDHVPGWMGGFIHPVNNMPNYGREIASEIGEGALMLHLNFTNAQKQTLLRRYVQLGIDLYGIVLDGGDNNWPANGGHASGRKWPIMFAGLVLGDAAMAHIGSSGVAFGEDGQTFYVTQQDIDRDHHPDERSCELEYAQTDLGLPEWGIVHDSNPVADNKNWTTVYRQCCTAHAWGGFVLSALIMGKRGNWNHEPLFDFMDRYMAVELIINGQGAWTRQWSDFAENMWDEYRDDYTAEGAVWTKANVADGLFCD